MKKEDKSLFDFEPVAKLMKEKKEKVKALEIPKKKRAQKEYIKDLLDRHQDKFEEVMNTLAECDPVKYAELYTKLSVHIIPKQNQLNVSVGLNKDYAELMALGNTNVSPEKRLGFSKVEEIEEVDFEELRANAMEGGDEE